MATDPDDVSDNKRRREASASPSSDMSMMRIAIAGTGGLARLIAENINQETAHHVVFLSRTPQPQLSNDGWQVSVINYRDIEILKFALRGIDTVISTVTGPEQIELIKAAVAARVRRFAPAEFEGPPRLRNPDDPPELDRYRSLAQQWLSHYSQNIQSTIFVCGILYERFQPGGLQRSSISVSSGLGPEGAYLMNCRRMFAQVPAYDQGNATICLTAAQDVARFVTRAIDMRHWPAELTMYGAKFSVNYLVELIQQLKGQRFAIQLYDRPSLQSELQLARAQQNQGRVAQLLAHMATAEGRYDYSECSLNQRFPEVPLQSFQDWFIAKWNEQH